MLPGTTWLLFLAAFSFSLPIMATPDRVVHAAGAAEAALAAAAPVMHGVERMGGSGPINAAPPSRPRPKVALIVVDGLDVELFADPSWRHLRALAEGGFIGLMNSRTATVPIPFASAAAHATIGAGTRAPAGAWSGHAFDVDDRFHGMPAGAWVAGLTGHSPPTNGIVVPGAAQMRRLAQGQQHGARPGTLGQRVAGLGGRLAVIGNADLPAAAVQPWAGRTADPLPLALPRQASAVDPGFIPRRHGALIGMDYEGHIPLGAVGAATLRQDEEWPFQWRTNYEKVWDAFTQVLPEADVIIVEFGDLARLDGMREWIALDRMAALQRETLGRIDAWIGRLLQWPPATGLYVGLLSPSPPDLLQRAGLWLTPALWSRVRAQSEAAAPPRLITSNTTRRIGLIANTDWLPHIVALLAVGEDPDPAPSAAPSGTLRLPLRAAPLAQWHRDVPRTTPRPPDAWHATALLYARAVAIHRWRPPMVQTFISAAIVLFLGWVAWTLYTYVLHRRAQPQGDHPLKNRTPAHDALALARGPALWKTPLLLLSAAPLAMLLLALGPVRTLLGPRAQLGGVAGLTLRTPSALVAGSGLILLTAILAGLAHGVEMWGRTRRRAKAAPGGIPTDSCPDGLTQPAGLGAFITIALLTALAIVTDVWQGSPLMKSSVFGYDPIVGARYYGLGNEYMGVLIGTALVGTTGWLEGGRKAARDYRWLLLMTYAVVTGTVAAPGLGANVGGTVAAVVGFGVTMLLLRGQSFSVRTGLYVAGALVVVLAGVAVYDGLWGTDGGSHLGQIVRAVHRNGWKPLWAVAARKVSMNVKLLRWTIWAQVFLVSLATSVWALYRPAPGVQRLERRHPFFVQGVRGAVVAALAALVANDSGVVAAATMMIPVTATFMYALVLQQAEKEAPAGPV